MAQIIIIIISYRDNRYMKGNYQNNFEVITQSCGKCVLVFGNKHRPDIMF